MRGPYRQAGSLANFGACDGDDVGGEFGKGQRVRDSVLVHGEVPKLGVPFQFP